VLKDGGEKLLTVEELKFIKSYLELRATLDDEAAIMVMTRELGKSPEEIRSEIRRITAIVFGAYLEEMVKSTFK